MSEDGADLVPGAGAVPEGAEARPASKAPEAGERAGKGRRQLVMAG